MFGRYVKKHYICSAICVGHYQKVYNKETIFSINQIINL